MVYRARHGQVSYGEPIGILLLDQDHCPFVPGDVANATTYSYPVRFQRVEGLTPARLFRHDRTLYEAVLAGARSLVRNGVRAVTSDCGFMALYQQDLARELGVPVMMSSLIQIPFISTIIGPERRIGVVTANAGSLTGELLQCAGVSASDRVVVAGLEHAEHFAPVAVHETADTLDTELVEREVVTAVDGLLRRDPELGAILLECSLLPPYGAAVHEAFGLPVFDFVTAIDFVCSSVVKRRYSGLM